MKAVPDCAAQRWTPFDGALALFAPIASVSAIAVPGEEALKAIAHAPRRDAAIAARVLARRALQAIGGPREVAIGRGESGAPLWPADYTGSLAHDAEHAIALVGERARFAALGVDIEPCAALPADAAALVIGAGERRCLDALEGGYARWSRALFGIKECVHKCVNPATGIWLEFDEVEVRIEAHGAASVTPLSDSAKTAAAWFGGTLGVGRVSFVDGAVLSALAIAASGDGG